MTYLFGIILLLQSIFWWLFRVPIIGTEWVVEFKFFKLIMFAFLAWIISGKSE